MRSVRRSRRKSHSDGLGVLLLKSNNRFSRACVTSLTLIFPSDTCLARERNATDRCNIIVCVPSSRRVLTPRTRNNISGTLIYLSYTRADGRDRKNILSSPRRRPSTIILRNSKVATFLILTVVFVTLVRIRCIMYIRIL